MYYGVDAALSTAMNAIKSKVIDFVTLGGGYTSLGSSLVH
jgi:hypothetical protein